MIDSDAEGLPIGWAVANLADIASIVMGQSPPSGTYNTSADGPPFFQGKAEFGDLYPAPRVWCSRPGKIAEENDILLSVRAPVGPTNLAPSRSCIGRGLAAVRVESQISLKYLLHAFRRFANNLDAKGTGTTFKAVSGKVVREFSIPVAPESEQIRIADALDELLSDLDAGVTSLTQVRAKLAMYRASVLKAAVDGSLTAEWRKQHTDAEPASELLKRILAERWRRWEEDQLRRFKEKGREPPTNWKAKYEEPVTPNPEGLPSLPNTWCWISIDQMTWSAGYGTSEKCLPTSTGLPVLRIPNVVDGGVRLDNLKFARPEYAQTPSERVTSGDLLVVRTNGSRTLIGRGAVVQEELIEHFSFASYLIRLRLTKLHDLLRWVSILWASSHVRTWVETRAATSAGQFNISLGVLQTLAVPLAPVEEQREIADTVDAQLSVIDHLESDIDAKVTNAKALRQAILRHAFTGQLVPQDPNDEPASELLKRIAAEREQRARAATAAKQAKRPTKTARTRPTGRAKKKAAAQA